MRSTSEIQKELYEKNTRLNQLKQELHDLDAPLKSKTSEMEKNIEQYERQKQSLAKPSVSGGYTAGIVLSIIGMIVGFFIDSIGAGIAIVACCLILLIVMCVKKSNAQKTADAVYQSRLNEYQEKIDENRTKMNKIRFQNPRIPEVEKEIGELEKDVTCLRKEFRDAEIAEKIGTGNVIVHVNRIGEYFGPKPNGGVGEINNVRYVPYLIIDGRESGIVAEPFSIIPLTPGIHSLAIRFDLPNLAEFTTKAVQFNTKDGNVYFTYRQPWFSSAGDTTFKMEKADNMDMFLSYARLDRSDVDNYLNSL